MKTVTKYLAILLSLSLSPLLGVRDDVKKVTITSSHPMHARVFGIDPTAADACKKITLEYSQLFDVVTVYFSSKDIDFMPQYAEACTLCFTMVMPPNMPEETILHFELTPHPDPRMLVKFELLTLTSLKHLPGSSPVADSQMTIRRTLTRLLQKSVQECIRDEHTWFDIRFCDGNRNVELGEPKRSLSECLKLQQNSMHSPE